MNWTPFWFDGNFWFGEVNSPEDWQAICGAYKRMVNATPEQLKQDATRQPADKDGCPHFSVYYSATPGQTLGEWAKEQGMEL